MILLLVFPLQTALSFRTESGLSAIQIVNATAKTWKSMTKHEKYLQMAKMASAAYDGTPFDDWEVYDTKIRRYDTLGVAISDKGKNIATLYHRPGEKLCALAFSGSEDGMDWQYNLNAIPRAYCGMYKIHRGFANTLDKFWKTDHGKELERQIQGDLCKSGTVVVGHSLGGAKAALFAACNNRQVRSRSARAPGHCKTVCKRDNCAATSTNPIPTNTPYKWAPVRTKSQRGCCQFWQGACDECCPYTHVKYGGYIIGLYTFGAPAVSWGKQIENLKRADRAFPGARFYIYHDIMYYDSVPNMLTHLHFVHPKMNAIKLGAEGEAAAKKVWSFRDPFSRKAPNVFLPVSVQKVQLEILKTSAAAVANTASGTDFEVNPHLMSSYIKRLEALQWDGILCASHLEDSTWLNHFM